MSNVIILLALGLFVLFGYRLMGKLDRFLDTRVKDDDDPAQHGGK